MANKKKLHKPFIPTEAQREVVKLSKAFCMKEEYIRRLIINPESGEPIGKNAFEKAFAYERECAKAELLRQAVSVCG